MNYEDLIKAKSEKKYPIFDISSAPIDKKGAYTDFNRIVNVQRQAYIDALNDVKLLIINGKALAEQYKLTVSKDLKQIGLNFENEAE